MSTNCLPALTNFMIALVLVLDYQLERMNVYSTQKTLEQRDCTYQTHLGLELWQTFLNLLVANAIQNKPTGGLRHLSAVPYFSIGLLVSYTGVGGFRTLGFKARSFQEESLYLMAIATWSTSGREKAPTYFAEISLFTVLL
jgi:hypothetical protein